MTKARIYKSLSKSITDANGLYIRALIFHFRTFLIQKVQYLFVKRLSVWFIYITINLIECILIYLKMYILN